MLEVIGTVKESFPANTSLSFRLTGLQLDDNGFCELFSHRPEFQFHLNSYDSCDPGQEF